MVIVDPQLALALLVKEKWNGTDAPPDAIDTVAWGVTTAEVMILTGGTIEEPERQVKQINFVNTTKHKSAVQTGEASANWVRALCLVPRRGDARLNQALLKDYCYQMAMEVERICHDFQGTALTNGSNNDYWISEEVRSNQLMLWPSWYAWEVVVLLIHTN